MIRQQGTRPNRLIVGFWVRQRAAEEGNQIVLAPGLSGAGQYCGPGTDPSRGCPEAGSRSKREGLGVKAIAHCVTDPESTPHSVK